MPRHIDVECFLEAVGNYLNAREDGDQDEMKKSVAQAEAWLGDDVSIARLRECVQPTVEEWLRGTGGHWDASHTRLVERIVASIHAVLGPAAGS